jgi:hypothetical protein
MLYCSHFIPCSVHPFIHRIKTFSQLES